MRQGKRQAAMPRATAPPPSPAFATSDVTGTGTVAIDYLQRCLRLLATGQMLCGQTQGITDRLCQEVMLATHGCAELALRHSRSPDRAEVLSSPTSFSFPIQFRNQVYGTLHVAPDPTQPASPAFPLIIAYLLAQICGSLLYTWELSALLHRQLPQFNHHMPGTLTRREREVLTLLCHGYNQETIAKELNIASKTVGKHREHIYERLGIHHESDVLLAAYLAGLYSPLEDITN